MTRHVRSAIPTPPTRLPARALASRVRTLCADDVAALRRAAIAFGPAAEDGKAAALSHAAGCALEDARVLVAYHDALLFLLAYPGSLAMRATAERELARVARASCAIAENGSARQRRRLEGNGIAGSEVTAAFSHSLCQWLASRHRRRAEVTGFGEEGQVAEVLALCLPRMESELTGASTDPLALLDDIKGPGQTRLAALLAVLRLPRVPEAVRAHLFESMQPFVTVRPGATPLSRTFARGPAATVFVHVRPLEKQLVDPAEAIAASPPPPPLLGPADRRTLIEVARASLAMLERETDPVTWPSAAGVVLYDLGRGAAVALYPMQPSRRFALDSHTGYLMLKNGIPIGYGGGWPFLATCRTGTNIFSPFRGGESSWLFARVLAVYRRHFGVKRFVVEPYQFGAGNREGLLSGAFWFYYRLGFRPVDRDVEQLARAEFSRLSKRGYRSPLGTMRALAASDLVLDLEPTTAVERCEPAEISRAVSHWIGSVHRGDRQAATRDATTRVRAALGASDFGRWARDEREAFRSLSLAIALIQDLERWSDRDKISCVELMRAKGRADDGPFFRALSAHPRLPAALAKIASAGR